MTLASLPYLRNMWLLLSGRFISSTLTALFVFAQALYVMDLSGSAGALSAVLIASMIPRALFNFLAGIWVDRYNRKKIMIGCDLVSGLCVLAFWGLFVFVSQSVWIFVALSFLLSGINTLFVIAAQTATAEMVGSALVMQTNAMQQSMKSLIVVLAPVLGALVYKTWGMEVVFVVNAISFFASACSEMMIRYQPEPPMSSHSVWEHCKIVRSYLGQNKPLRTLFFVAIAIQMLFEPMTTLVLPFAAYQILKVSAFQLSLINGLSAFGVVSAALLITARKRKIWLSKFFFLLEFQGLLFMMWAIPALDHRLSASVITLFFVIFQILGRFTNTIQNVPLISHFQVGVPEEIRGRVFGFFYAAVYLTCPIALWIFSLLLKNVNWFLLPIGVGACVMVVAGVMSRSEHMKTFFEGLGRDF